MKKEYTTIRIEKTTANRLKHLIETTEDKDIASLVLNLMKEYEKSKSIAHNLEGCIAIGDTLNVARADGVDGQNNCFDDVEYLYVSESINSIGVELMHLVGNDGTTVSFGKDGKTCFWSRTIKRRNNPNWTTRIDDNGRII